MHKFSLFFCLASSVATSALADGDYDKGKELIRSWECIHCHGLTGNERWTDTAEAAVPMLAGQPARYLVKALKEFRSGDRIDGSRSQRMSLITGQLTDQDIEDIAAYYAAQKRY